MLLFFTAAALLSYSSIARLVSDRWIALAATLLAFSSYYCLYYSDMVFNDIPSLFGVVLVCHGMIVFLQGEPIPAVIAKGRGRVVAGMAGLWSALACRRFRTSD